MLAVKLFGALVGVFLLMFGADFMVAGSSDFARRLRIRQIIIGLTFVALGTSAPELGVTMLSGASGNSAMALGNVVGSVIFNILLILGLYACMSPMKVHHHVTKVDLWVMCLFALLLLPLSIIVLLPERLQLL